MSELKEETRFDYTSKEAYNIPIFRIAGTKDTIVIVDNRINNRVSLPSVIVDSLIEQLLAYKEVFKDEA